MNYATERHTWGPNQEWALENHGGTSAETPLYNQWNTPYEPFPAEVEEAHGAASSSGYVKPRPSSLAVPKNAGK